MRFYLQELDRANAVNPHVLRFLLMEMSESASAVSLEIAKFIFELYQGGKYYFLTDFFNHYCNVLATTIMSESKGSYEDTLRSPPLVLSWNTPSSLTLTGMGQL